MRCLVNNRAVVLQAKAHIADRIHKQEYLPADLQCAGAVRNLGIEPILDSIARNLPVKVDAFNQSESSRCAGPMQLHGPRAAPPGGRECNRCIGSYPGFAVTFRFNQRQDRRLPNDLVGDRV